MMYLDASASAQPSAPAPIRIPLSQPCLGPLERELVNLALTNNQLTYGPLCREFEERLATYLDVAHCVVTSSGTTALHLALAASGIGPGDEVIVPDLTFVATANAVAYTGATPVLADVDRRTWCIDPSHVESLITPRTRAIVPVHLYGHPCDMGAVYFLADHHNLLVIEDAAEGFGGTYCEPWQRGRLQGTSPVSHCGVFSFYGNKVLTTGEGGAVVTNDPILASKLRHLRGQAMSTSQRYFHTDIGYNYRLTEFQAAIGLGQLSHLDRLLSSRRAIIDRYRSILGLDSPSAFNNINSAPWLYTALVPNDISRDGLMAHLANLGIETRPAFVPLHIMPMYWGASFPTSTHISSHAISLPTYPDLTLTQVDEVCAAVTDYLESNT